MEFYFPRLISSLYSSALQLLYPAYCIGCKDFLDNEQFLCFSCERSLSPIVAARIRLTEQQNMAVYAVADYCEPLRTLILAKHKALPLASKQMAQLIWKKTAISQLDFDYIVPIPLHWSRYAWRGFNQGDIMAEELSRLSKKPVLHVLKRKKRTTFQSELGFEERIENIKGAFQLISNASIIKNKHILLIDDLMTTSATLSQVAKTMLSAKPLKISAAVCCRTLQ